MYDGISGGYDVYTSKAQAAETAGKSGIKKQQLRLKTGLIDLIQQERPKDAIMNEDGSVTTIEKWNDGTNACQREVTYVYDENGNKIIKSVKNMTSELYGIKSTTTELIDTDGDGYADECVVNEIDGGKVTEKKVKYPKVDEKTDKHELAHQGRNMAMEAAGCVCYSQ